MSEWYRILGRAPNGKVQRRALEFPMRRNAGKSFTLALGGSTGAHAVWVQMTNLEAAPGQGPDFQVSSICARSLLLHIIIFLLHVFHLYSLL